MKSTGMRRGAMALIPGVSVLLLVFAVTQASAGVNGWAPSEAVSGTEGSSYSPHLVADSQDKLHLVWYDWIDLISHPPYILYASKAVGGNWTLYEHLPGKPMGDSPAIALDSSDSLHVVWTGLDSIGYARRTANGAWGDVEAIPGSTDGVYPDVAVDPGGTVHAVWVSYGPGGERRVDHSARTAGAGWGAVTRVYTGPEAGNLLLEADTQGTLHLLINTTGAGIEARYAAKPAGGGWGTAAPLPFAPFLKSVEQLACDAQGELHLVWQEQEDETHHVYHAGKELGRDWSAPSAVLSGPNAEVAVHAVAVAVRDTGPVHVAWTSYAGDRSAWYAYGSAETVWSAPSLVDGDLVGSDNKPTIAVDGRQGHYIAWDSGPTFTSPSGDGRGEIWLSWLDGAPPVSQVITPPGGTVHSGSGDVRLDFPPGSVDGATEVTIGPVSKPPTDGLVGLRFFDLSAEKVADGSPVTTFDPPYTLTVAYATSGHGTAIESTLGLYWWDGERWQREASSNLDLTNQRVSATPDHMTPFALLGETRRVFLPIVTR